MKVTVTQKDIDDARVILRDPKNSRAYNCPISLAVRRLINSKAVITITGLNCVSIGNIRYELPTNAIKFLVDFDQSYKRVEPFEFELEYEHS